MLIQISKLFYVFLSLSKESSVRPLVQFDSLKRNSPHFSFENPAKKSNLASIKSVWPLALGQWRFDLESLGAPFDLDTLIALERDFPWNYWTFPRFDPVSSAPNNWFVLPICRELFQAVSLFPFCCGSTFVQICNENYKVDHIWYKRWYSMHIWTEKIFAIVIKVFVENYGLKINLFEIMTRCSHILYNACLAWFFSRSSSKSFMVIWIMLF